MDECMYCAKDERMQKLMQEVIRLSAGTLYMHKEGSYPGRCILVLNQHKHKVTELTKEEFDTFFSEARLCAAAIDELYHPDKINYLVLGDLSPHLHLHLVPKYKGGCDWGEIFQMLPDPERYLDEEELTQQIWRLKNAVEAKIEQR